MKLFLAVGSLQRTFPSATLLGPKKNQAVALYSNSKRSVLYRCGVFGYQDTLLVNKNTQFYRECKISGTVDFIFGYAAAVFQKCHILVKKGLGYQQNAITAQGGPTEKNNTLLANKNTQFYRECKISGAVDFIFGYVAAVFQIFFGYAAAVFQKCHILVKKGLGYQQNAITAQGGPTEKNNTLLVNKNTQFYRECKMSGTIDFIFGYAAAVFQKCHILVKKGLGYQQNAITAQGGSTGNNKPFGFSFQFCSITADSNLIPYVKSTQTFLERPWQPYSQVIFMQSEISNVLSPKGWLEWNGTENLDTLSYAEFHNYGPGAKLEKRVKWTMYRTLPKAATLMVVVFT